MNDVYVCYLDTGIMCIGTKKECTTHRDNQPFDASSWKITDIETYGDACFSTGYDCGYDSGRDEN